jgi:hypothetical protein
LLFFSPQTIKLQKFIGLIRFGGTTTCNLEMMDSMLFVYDGTRGREAVAGRSLRPEPRLHIAVGCPIDGRYIRGASSSCGLTFRRGRTSVRTRPSAEAKSFDLHSARAAAATAAADSSPAASPARQTKAPPSPSSCPLHSDGLDLLPKPYPREPKPRRKP